MLIHVLIFLVLEGQHELCTIYSHDSWHSGVLDVICIKTTETEQLSLGSKAPDRKVKEVHVVFVNDTCIKQPQIRCTGYYFARSFSNVSHLKQAVWTCYDPLKSAPTFDDSEETLDDSIRNQQHALLCDIRCETSNVTTNILHVIGNTLVKSYVNTDIINITSASYEFSGTYICQIAFTGNYTINGSGLLMHTKGILSLQNLGNERYCHGKTVDSKNKSILLLRHIGKC